MAGLILELQKEAIDSTISLTELLRKALVVATKLNIKDFKEWIDNELNGYMDKDNIPSYRKVTGITKAWNPYRGWIPMIIQNDFMANTLRQRFVKQSVGDLQSLVENSKDGFLLMHYPPKIENMLMRDEPDLQPALHIGVNTMNGILQIVRNTVLEWALKLEEEGIIGEGLSFSVQEKEKAQASPNINIHNFQGILGDVTSSSINQDLKMSIQTDDFKSLANFLKAKNVSKEDISELENAIKDDPKPISSDKLGEKVSGWIGKMISKAALGTWQITVSTAGTLLGNAISAYYGFLT